MFVYKKFEDLSDFQKNAFSIGLKYIDSIVQTHNETFPNESESKYCAGIIGMILFKLPTVFTGLISEAAQEALLSNKTTYKKLCKEHFHSRSLSGKMILNEFSALTNIEKLDILVKYCHVHNVLPSENISLRKVQRNELLSWEKQYEECGIKLIPNSKLPRRKRSNKNIFLINDIPFNNVDEIVQHFNISKSAATFRLYKGYSKWKIERITI